MSICVVAIHTHPFETISNRIVLDVYDEFVRMAVPFFFMVNGYLLTEKISLTQKEKNDDYETVKHFIFKLLRLYIVWSIIYLPLAIYKYVTDGNGLLRSVFEYIKDFVFLGQHFYSWQLWYLLSALYASLVLYLIVRNKCNSIRLVTLLVIVFLCFDLFCTRIVNEAMNVTYCESIRRVIESTIHDGGIFRGVYYILIGTIISRKKEILCYRKEMWIGFICFFFASVIFHNEILSVMSRIFFFCVVLNLRMHESKYYYFARRTSMVIYFTHMWFFAAWVMMNGYPRYGVLSFVWTVILSILTSIAVIWFERYSCGRKIIRLLF